MAPRQLETIAREQDGLITRWQALGCGLSGRQYDRRAHGGAWQFVLPGVAATFTGALDRQQQRRAALLYADRRGQRPDRPCMLTGDTAVHAYGLRAVGDPAAVQLLVPRPRRVRPVAFVVVTSSARTERPVQVSGLPATSVARAVADAARSTDDRRLVLALVGEAVQRGFTTVGRLERELLEGPRRGRALFAGALSQVSTGTRSAPEADLRAIVAATGLPEPEWNADLRVTGAWVARPDALWRAPCLALEADSREWHLSPADWEHTMRRHNRMTAAGCTVLHFPPSRLARDQRQVSAEIVATYRRLESQLDGDRETPHHRRR